MDLDMTDSLAPKSDQLDAVDLLSGPRTFTIEKVSKGNPEQPFNFHLAEFPRVWRPGKSMRRVIVAAWGGKTSAYAGQSVTLYCDPSVQFGGDTVGGTRISHMTGIDKPLKVPLLIKRGKSAVFTVQPLAHAPKAARAEPNQVDATIPDDVKAATEKAVAEGTIDQYIAWLAEKNAPEHIIDYVSERKPS
jgi:hypothetical protein